MPELVSSIYTLIEESPEDALLDENCLNSAVYASIVHDINNHPSRDRATLTSYHRKKLRAVFESPIEAGTAERVLLKPLADLPKGKRAKETLLAKEEEEGADDSEETRRQSARSLK